MDNTHLEEDFNQIVYCTFGIRDYLAIEIYK